MSTPLRLLLVTYQATHVLGVLLPVIGCEGGPSEGDQHVLARVLQRCDVFRVRVAVGVESAVAATGITVVGLSRQAAIAVRQQEAQNDICVGQAGDSGQGYWVSSVVIVDDVTWRCGAHDFSLAHWDGMAFAGAIARAGRQGRPGDPAQPRAPQDQPIST